LIRNVVRCAPVPLVIDADGINAFGADPGGLRNENGNPIIITPHPGEMASLTRIRIADIQKDRLKIAEQWAVRHGVFVILKGFQTILAAPSGIVLVNTTGNPGMATGGTGDILAGMLGRFVAGWQVQQKRGSAAALMESLAAAVHLHGLAGDIAAEAHGAESMTATDLVTFLPAAFTKAGQE
jgi:NAD(P)H-hydrate epimerase